MVLDCAPLTGSAAEPQPALLLHGTVPPEYKDPASMLMR